MSVPDRRGPFVQTPATEALPAKTLVALAQASRPRREPDRRNDLDPPKPKTIPATDADFFSPMG